MQVFSTPATTTHARTGEGGHVAAHEEDEGRGLVSSKVYLHTGCPICSWTWVGSTLIWVFHLLAQMPNRFCQIPISPAELGRQWNTKKVNPTQSTSSWDTLYTE